MADNPDELFDVVDADDRVIGTARRADVHARRLRHRAVHILVRNRAGKVFLQKRSMAKDSQPGKWDSSASGHLDSGEAYEAAAIRELGEELGILTGSVEEIGRIPACEVTGEEFVRIYRTSHEGPFHLHPQEIAEGKWVAIPELNEWILRAGDDFAPCFLAVWRQVGAGPGMA